MRQTAMTNYSFFQYLLILMLVVSGSSMQAQEEVVAEEEEYSGINSKSSYLESDIETRSFSQAEWKKAIEGIDYSGETQKDVDIDEDEDDGTIGEGGDVRERRRSRSGGGGMQEFWASFFKVLFVILAILVIALVAYFLIGGTVNKPQNRKFEAGDASISIQEVEENIHESDLDKFIRQALAEGNYALAVRLYYLAVIKELSLNKKIKWKRDKTNRDYLNETRSTPLFQPFRKATRIFERIWYGNSELDKRKFEDVQPMFQNLIKRVKGER